MSANPRAPVNGYPSTANHDDDPYAAPTFFRSFLLTLLALVLITGILLLIFWIVFRPRAPAFYVTSLSLSNYSVSASAFASPSVTATWLLTLRAVNPNKKIPISYNEFVSLIAYRDESLATTSVPPFYQGKSDTTDLKIAFTDKNYHVSLRTANGMERDRKGGGIVNFDVRVRALARLKTKGWYRARMRIVRVICLGIPVIFTGNPTGWSGLSGQFIGRERKCRVLI